MSEQRMMSDHGGPPHVECPDCRGAGCEPVGEYEQREREWLKARRAEALAFMRAIVRMGIPDAPDESIPEKYRIDLRETFVENGAQHLLAWLMANRLPTESKSDEP